MDLLDSYSFVYMDWGKIICENQEYSECKEDGVAC